MSVNRLPADFRDPPEPAGPDAADQTVELTDRGRETLEILNDLFDEPDDAEDCGC